MYLEMLIYLRADIGLVYASISHNPTLKHIRFAA